MGFLRVPNLVRWVIFRAWIVSDQFCWIRFHLNLTGREEKKEKMTTRVRGAGEDDYTREAIIFNISTKRGRLFEGGDLSRDGYYSRKYGTSAMIIQKKFKSWNVLQVLLI